MGINIRHFASGYFIFIFKKIPFDSNDFGFSCLTELLSYKQFLRWNEQFEQYEEKRDLTESELSDIWADSWHN